MSIHVGFLMDACLSSFMQLDVACWLRTLSCGCGLEVRSLLENAVYSTTLRDTLLCGVATKGPDCGLREGDLGWRSASSSLYDHTKVKARHGSKHACVKRRMGSVVSISRYHTPPTGSRSFAWRAICSLAHLQPACDAAFRRTIDRPV